MNKKYSEKTKRDAVESYRNGESTASIARRLGCAPYSVLLWNKAAKKTARTRTVQVAGTTEPQRVDVDVIITGLRAENQRLKTALADLYLRQA